MFFSIIITAYNYENYVVECINSCLNQTTNENYEVIVINDGSTDATEEKIKSISDSRLCHYTIENSGIEVASNLGFRKSLGKYLVRVDADDLLHPDYLKKMLLAIKSSTADFFYPNYSIIDNDGKVTSNLNLPDFDVNEIFDRGDFLATGTVYKSKVLKSVDYYSELVKNSGLENYELILNLIKAGFVGQKVDENLFSYRRHSLNLSEVKRDRIIRYGKELFAKLSLGIFTTNEFHPYMLKL